MPTNLLASRISAREYMDNREFTLGIMDARAGRPFRKAYEDWPTQKQWFYETGRQLAYLLPRDLKSRTANGKPNPKAVRILERHFGIVL
jgi:hypothetical protein